ncbi:hypothetical protein EIP86_008540 [Pleurotus ostreatoroseus]|nr:hypothetical protein EIP86_008540 [Pleurotus ostreatoroseus]
MSATRALRQLAVTSSRTFAPRTLARVALPAFRAAAVPAPVVRAFSVSARRLGEGASDVALSQKLAEELKYEKEAGTPSEPEFLTKFKSHNVWKIEDTLGNDEVALTRHFGNESIRLMFSIVDIQADQEAEFEETEEGQEEDQEAPIHSYPIRCSFTITKNSVPGSMSIDAMCQDGGFVIDNISFYTDAKIGTELTAEADWKRRGLYIGPQFDTLDVTVQEQFEKFLEERGIDETLAAFIPEYAEHKEQKAQTRCVMDVAWLWSCVLTWVLQEYVSWLQNVKQFVEA